MIPRRLYTFRNRFHMAVARNAS